MKIIERFYQYLAENSLKPSNVEKEIGLSNGYLSAQKKRNADVGEGVILKIVEFFPDLSPLWLLTGDGDMIRGEKDYKELPDNTHIISDPSYSMHNSCDNKNIIRYYPSVSGSMGGLSFLDNPDEKFQELLIPGFHGCKVAINAFGDSMHPLIKSGQVILLQEWLESFIEWGENISCYNQKWVPHC